MGYGLSSFTRRGVAIAKRAARVHQGCESVKGDGNVGAVDADAEKGIASQFQVQGFPTIKIFGADKTNPKPYQGQRNARGLVDGLLAEYRSIANGRLGGSGGSQGARRALGAALEETRLATSLRQA